MKCTACGEVVKPVVALDLDGTLAAYHEHFLEFAEQYLGWELDSGWDGSGNWEDYLKISREEYRRTKLAYRQGGGKRMMPAFEYATQLTYLLREAGAEIWITTTRPYNLYDSTDPDTREWLRRHDIQYDYLLYDEHKYERLHTLVDPERVVGVLDDLPDQYEAAVRVFGRSVAVLRCQQHNVAFRSHGFIEAVVSDLRDAADVFAARVEHWSKA